MKLCAVIPAAGRGSRLGLDRPKILAPVSGDATIWSVLKTRLKPFADRIHVVVSPGGANAFHEALLPDPDRTTITTSIQPVPLGMGDAIFGCAAAWADAEAIVIVWGDQVHVSAQTFAATLALHGGRPRTIGLPLVALDDPYVEYRFDDAGQLTAILQSREGDCCAASGFGDVGTFVLSTEGLAAAWRSYVTHCTPGKATGEINFLPFLVHLAEQGWGVDRYLVADTREARGINTPEDLAFFRDIYQRSEDKTPRRAHG